jgi:hypothetical protein
MTASVMVFGRRPIAERAAHFGRRRTKTVTERNRERRGRAVLYSAYQPGPEARCLYNLSVMARGLLDGESNFAGPVVSMG